MEKKLPLNEPDFKLGCNGYRVVLILIFAFFNTTAFSQVKLVKDINPVNDFDHSEFGSLTNVNGTLFFVSDATTLWKSNGTEAAIRLKEFINISYMVSIGDVLFFVANDGVTGYELWRSDGTTAGTLQVRDIRLGPLNSRIDNFTNVNGVAYFTADDGISGLEVWRSDGTRDGTRRVKDIIKGMASGKPTNLISYNNKLFFVSNGPGGYELWNTDGTEKGTYVLKDIMPGKTSSSPEYLTLSGGLLYFRAKHPTMGKELWKTDGTPVGTVVVKDINEGASSFPDRLIDVNGTLFFVANDGKHGFEWWKSNGTSEGTTFVKDIIEGKTGLTPWLSHDNIALNGLLYFQYLGTIYQTDGTSDGTIEVTNLDGAYDAVHFVAFNDDLYYFDVYNEFGLVSLNSTSKVKEITGEPYYWNYNLIKSGNALYFLAMENGGGPAHLWQSDGTAAGTHVFKEGVGITLSSYPSNLTNVNETLFFTVRRSNNEYGDEFWKSDGTSEGTKMIKPIYAGLITDVNGIAYFSSENPDTYERELWRSNGTESGTYKVSSVDPKDLTNVNGTLYFVNDFEYPTTLLWTSNGTESGTKRVVNVGNEVAMFPKNLTNVNGILYFTASDGSTGRELWRVKDNGAILIKDINPGTASANPQNLVAHNQSIFFIANSGTNGYELWQSNGSKSGTVMIKDLSEHQTIYDVKNLISIGAKLYFAVRDDSGWALWKSDATASGTIKIMDFAEGNENIDIFSGLNEEVYFMVSDENFMNHQLWKSNGTDIGTIFLAQVGTLNQELDVSDVVKDGILYMNIAAEYEYQIWRTDGTTCGTFQLTYGNNLSQGMVKSGSTIFMAGEFKGTGVELLKLEANEINAPACDNITTSERAKGLDNLSNSEFSLDAEKIISSYPNPYHSEYKLRVNRNTNETYHVQILNMNGIQVSTYSDLKCNVDYNMGAALSSGIYLIKVNLNNRLITKKIIKDN